MKVYQRLAGIFVTEGGTHLFGVMGDGNRYWMHELDRIGGVQMLEVRHEGAGLGALQARHARHEEGTFRHIHDRSGSARPRPRRQGAQGRSVEELPAAVREWVAKPAPMLIDARISRTLPCRRIHYGEDVQRP